MFIGVIANHESEKEKNSMMMYSLSQNLLKNNMNNDVEYSELIQNVCALVGADACIALSSYFINKGSQCLSIPWLQHGSEEYKKSLENKNEKELVFYQQYQKELADLLLKCE